MGLLGDVAVAVVLPGGLEALGGNGLGAAVGGVEAVGRLVPGAAGGVSAVASKLSLELSDVGRTSCFLLSEFVGFTLSFLSEQEVIVINNVAIISHFVKCVIISLGK